MGRVMRENDLGYEFVEESNAQDLIDGVAAGKYDIVVAAMTPSAAREQFVDFTPAVLRIRAWDRRFRGRTGGVALVCPRHDIILDAIHGEWWDRMLFQYFGSNRN
jgi:Bacterial extracellular solute-binding proteins, family 3